MRYTHSSHTYYPYIVLQFKAHEGAQDVSAFFAALKVIEMEGSPPFIQYQHLSNRETGTAISSYEVLFSLYFRSKVSLLHHVEIFRQTGLFKNCTAMFYINGTFAAAYVIMLAK